jgi:integrase
MSIQNTPDGGFKVRWRDGSAHRAKTFKKGEKKQAQDFEREIDRAKRLGYLPQLERSTTTVEDACIEWATAEHPNLAPRTAALYSQTYTSHIRDQLGHRLLSDLTPAGVEEWLRGLDTGPTAKRRALQLLSRVYNRAMRNGDVHANPCLLAKKPRVPKSLDPAYAPSPLEVEAVRKRLIAAKRVGDAALVSLLAYAGPRPNEAWRLTWEDVREETILLRASKTGRVRTVPILSPLRMDLDNWRAQNPEALVFPTATGKQFTKDTWDNWRNRIWSKVGKATFRPYDLRHGYVSLMLRDPDVSRMELCQWAGHTLDVQDKTYAHLVDGLTGQGPAEEAIWEAREKVNERVKERA